MTTTIEQSVAKAMEAIRNDAGVLMALSLYNLSHESDYREIGGHLAGDFVNRSYDPATDEGKLADAHRVLDHEEPALYGMTFHNMMVNLTDSGVDIREEYPSAPARELVLKVVAAHPKLAARVGKLKPVIPY